MLLLVSSPILAKSRCTAVLVEMVFVSMHPLASQVHKSRYVSNRILRFESF
jgi:hypothetical protein